MKKVLSVALLTVWVFGCNQTKNILPFGECMPYSIRLETSGNASVYEYDDKKRVAKIRYGTGNDYIIKYSPTGFMEYYDRTAFGVPNPTTSDNVIDLDDRGRITRYVQTANGPFETRITYNSNGFMSTISYYVIGKITSTTDYTYTDGNLTQSVITNDRGVKKTTRITYYPDFKNTGRITEYIFSDGLSNLNIGHFELGFMMGNNAKNLPKRIDTGTGLTDYTYEFDSQSRINKITAQDPTATYRKQVYIITYDCP